MQLSFFDLILRHCQQQDAVADFLTEHEARIRTNADDIVVVFEQSITVSP
jgi:hypothetical protein